MGQGVENCRGPAPNRASWYSRAAIQALVLLEKCMQPKHKEMLCFWSLGRARISLLLYAWGSETEAILRASSCGSSNSRGSFKSIHCFLWRLQDIHKSTVHQRITQKVPETHRHICRIDTASQVSRKPLIQAHVGHAFSHFINFSFFPIWFKMSSFPMMQLHWDSNTAALFGTSKVLIQYSKLESHSYFICFSSFLPRKLI